MSQPDEAQCLQQFYSRTNSECKISRTGPDSDDSISFNSIPPIEEYFKAKNHEKLNAILAALFESEAPPGIAEIIVKGYVAVFCILLYIGKGRHIQNFVEYQNLNDGQLPFWPTHPPPNFPQSSDENFFKKFCEKQWRFCCPTFSRNILYKPHFNKNLILPIADKQKLGEGGSAELYKIRIHDDYNQLHSVDVKIKLSSEYANTFVLKTYIWGDTEENYRNEVAAFQRLTQNAPYIIGYYGSFSHGETHNIILEYADKGDLERYFMTIAPPQSGEEILSFWEGMFNLLTALMDIHMSKRQSSLDAPVYQGLHQDVKPQNILIVSNEEALPCNWQFKLGDLGLTRFKKLSPLQVSTAIDAQGTRTYGAPECYRNKNSRGAQLVVTPKADIWSLGCIYSEAARWVATGREGLLDYRWDRQLETKKITGFEDGSCFHNGIQALRTVRESNKVTISKLHDQDTITDRVLGSMVHEMLDSNIESRPTAKQLGEKAYRILTEARKDLNNRISRSTSFSSLASRNTAKPPPPPVLPPSFRPPPLYRTSQDDIEHQPTKTNSPPRDRHIRSFNLNKNSSTAEELGESTKEWHDVMSPTNSSTSGSLDSLRTGYILSCPKEHKVSYSTLKSLIIEHGSHENSLEGLENNDDCVEIDIFCRECDPGRQVRYAQRHFTTVSRRSTLPAQDTRGVDMPLTNPFGRTVSLDLHRPRPNIKSHDKKDIVDGSHKKKLTTKAQPLYCFSADGRSLLVWAKSASKIFIYEVGARFCRSNNAVDVYLAAGGGECYATVSQIGDHQSLSIYQKSNHMLITSVPLESLPLCIAMSSNDRFVAIGISGKAIVYNTSNLSENWTHVLPLTDNRKSKCERVWFSTDSNKLLAARRTEKGTVNTYVSDCQTQTATYIIPHISNPQGHYQDFGVSSILYDNQSGYACVTACGNKMPPAFFSLQNSTKRDTLGGKDRKDLGTEIQCAAIHRSAEKIQFILVNSENYIFSIQQASTDQWQVGKICKLPLKDIFKKTEMTVIAVPTPNTIYAFRIQGEQRILITIKINDKKPILSTLDISDEVLI